LTGILDGLQARAGREVASALRVTENRVRVVEVRPAATAAAYAAGEDGSADVDVFDAEGGGGATRACLVRE